MNEPALSAISIREEEERNLLISALLLLVAPIFFRFFIATIILIPLVLVAFVFVLWCGGHACANILALRSLRKRGWEMVGYMDAACARRYLGDRFGRLPPWEHIGPSPMMSDPDFDESFWRLMEFTRDYWREREALNVNH